MTWLVIIVVVTLGLWWANSSIKDIDTTNTEVPVVENATLSAVGQYTGTGSATRSFDGQTFIHTVEATLSDPAEGKFYEGWLVVPNSEGFFSTGKLTKDGDKWKLTYASDYDESIYALVVITEETLADGLDGKPETHVLEGSF
ncbi:hypothetical protein KKE14_00090 [Patescibacteria group bacterium]|nr:hypothetical protein [Patescibacteria group bacterium]